MAGETYRFQNYTGAEMATLFDKIAALGPATAASPGTMSAADKNKLDGITSGAQANVIEGVSIGGVRQSVSNKVVTIPLDDSPTSGSTNLVKSGGVFYALSQKYSKPSGGIPATDLASAVQASLGKADTAVQPAGITGKEDKTNKVTSVSAQSTNDQYPSAKCVYDKLHAIATVEDDTLVINIA